MKFEKVRRNTTLEIIIKQIKDQIRSGELNTGDKLPSERELSELLGVSRTSVREAIKALTFSGYLDVIQGKGAFVSISALKYDEISKLLSKISDFSLTSLIETRMMLEGEFARLAALRANNKDIEDINSCLDGMRSSTSTRIFVIKDLDFHMTIAEATHNKFMSTLMKIIGDLLHNETYEITKYSIPIKNRIIDVSEKLCNAIKNGDSKEAKKFMLEHLQIVEKSMND